MTAAEEERALRSALARVARRLWLGRALQQLLRATAAGSGVLSVTLLAARVATMPSPRSGVLLGILAIALGSALVASLRPVSTAQAATTLDQVYGLGERFTTAVECIGQQGAMHRLVVRDAARCSRDADPRLIPRAPLHRDAWLAVTGIALATLLWLQPGVPPASLEVHHGASGARVVVIPGTGSEGTAGSGQPGESQPPAAGELREALRPDEGHVPIPRSEQQDPGEAKRAEAKRAEMNRAEANRNSPEAAREQAGATPRQAPDRGATAGAAPGRLAAGGNPPLESRSIPRTALSEGVSDEAAGGAAGKSGVAAGQGVQEDDRRSGMGDTAPDMRGPEGEASREPGGASARDGAGERSSESRAAFARAPVPPGLRDYILRYFDTLGMLPTRMLPTGKGSS